MKHPPCRVLPRSHHHGQQVEETFGPVQAPLYAVRRCKAADGDDMVQVRDGWGFCGGGRAFILTSCSPCLVARSLLEQKRTTW